MENRGKIRVLAIPDLHCPFEHADTVEFLAWVKRKWTPDQVVCLGDEMDFHSLSDYDHDPNGLSAVDELNEGIEHLEAIYDLFPKVLVCTSNHTARPFRQAYKHGIPREFLRDYSEFLRAPKGWTWSDAWEVDGIRYEHGEGVSGNMGALKAATANMTSTVIGHIHSYAGIQYLANDKHLIFGFNAGCLIDRTKYAFAYGKTIRVKPVIGVGIIDKGIPAFIPMLLDKSGRWIGRKKK